MFCVIAKDCRPSTICGVACGRGLLKPLQVSHSRWWLWLFVAIHCRIGEALVPGPPVWNLGVCNPSGMAGKLNIFDFHPCDVWMISETHLSTQGMTDFRTQLKWSKQGYKYLITGYPASHRSDASSAGTWTGVAVLSMHPTRKAPTNWPPLVFESGRICTTVTYCHNLWLTGCTVYGTPKGGTHANAREKTDQLLNIGVDRLLDAAGPRYLAGDWNHDVTKLEAARRLENLGWVEIQDLWFSRTGFSPQATCRLKTRRDYLFISPELIPLFCSCKIDDTIWPDHSAIIATFEGGQSELTRFVWPQPQPLPWDVVKQLPNQSVVDFSAPADCTDTYRHLWDQVEQAASHVASTLKCQIPKKCFGRATIRAPVPLHIQRGPVKIGRAGEFTPKFVGVDLQHAQFVKQLRRVQSYARLASSWKGHQCADHRFELWRAIVRAPGFFPDFVTWWSGLELSVGDQLFVPLSPPDSDVAWRMFGVLDREVVRLERALIKARCKNKTATRKDINECYRAVRKPAPQAVDVLSQNVVGTIAAIDHADCAIEFNNGSQVVGGHSNLCSRPEVATCNGYS